MRKNNLKNYKITIISNVIIVCMLFVLSIFTIFNQTKNLIVSSDDVYYNGNTKQNYVTLMINIYWGNEYIPDMLNTLKEYNITTTFFVGGSWVEKNPELFLKIVENGHEIGNHGYFHKEQNKLNYAQNQSEIYNTHAIVKKYCNIDMNLFAPPSGAYSSVTLDVARNLGYNTIMWSRDTIDWRDQNEDLIIKRATNNIKNGDLILMHPTQKTMLALPTIIEKLLQQGFKIVTVSQNICINID